MRWDAFVDACPEIASLAEERFRTDELVMLGTLRADGSPRISPCELDVAEGHLFFGMMWRSKKALDLLRDPRCVVHSVTCDRMGIDGDLKLYGRMIDVHEPALRLAYRDGHQGADRLAARRARVPSVLARRGLRRLHDLRRGCASRAGLGPAGRAPGAPAGMTRPAGLQPTFVSGA